MAIVFEGQAFELLPGETVLEGLERHGHAVRSFCRAGVCQSCMLKARSGVLPAASQRDLKRSLRVQGMFLSCVCRPEGDLEIERGEVTPEFQARVLRVEGLTRDVLRVTLSRPDGFEFRAGQFIQLERPSDALMRPYSIASLPTETTLELHVALLPAGRMSGWLANAEGAPVTLRGPFGECFYVDDESTRPLLLAGTGTGLAPLLGVLRAALGAGHRGPIHLYHGSPDATGLYLWRELQALEESAPELRVIGSVLSAGEATLLRGVRAEPLEQAVLGDLPNLTEHRVFLCGNPELVKCLKKRIYLAGTPLERIHADPFVAPA
jgi:CDP-4-dehydro-6-deoxyglucose reductase